MFKVGTLVRIKPHLLLLMPSPRGIGVIVKIMNIKGFVPTAGDLCEDGRANLLIYWSAKKSIQFEFDSTVEVVKCSR
jgi:hypothetical protein